MTRVKSLSRVSAAFVGGILVASLVWLVFFKQTSNRIPGQIQPAAQHVSLPSALGDAIQAQTNLGSVSPLNKPIDSGNKGGAENAENQIGEPVFGANFEMPETSVVTNPPSNPKLVQLPLEPDNIEETPEPEGTESTNFTGISQEPPEPSAVDVRTIPQYSANK